MFVIPFPTPATSHAACGFPALRVPAHFSSVEEPDRTGAAISGLGRQRPLTIVSAQGPLLSDRADVVLSVASNLPSVSFGSNIHRRTAALAHLSKYAESLVKTRLSGRLHLNSQFLVAGARFQTYT